MRYLFILYFTLCASVCFSQKTNNAVMEENVASETYKSDEFKLSISYSDKFAFKEEMKTEDRLGIRLFGPNQLKTRTIENLAIKVMVLETEPPLSVFYQQQEKNMLSNGFFELIEKEDTTISELPAKYLLTTFTEKAIKEKKVQPGIMSAQFYMVSGTHLYIMTASYMEEHKKRSLAIFKELIETIEICE